MASQGQLPAAKIADRWVIERSVVEQRHSERLLCGRRFTPRNARAMLLLASGEDAPHLDPTVAPGLGKPWRWRAWGLCAPTSGRAGISTYKAHPGEISYVLEDKALLRSGKRESGTLTLGLLSGREADGYIAQSQLRRFVSKHALAPADAGGNVQLRVVPADVWPNLSGRASLPRRQLHSTWPKNRTRARGPRGKSSSAKSIAANRAKGKGRTVNLWLESAPRLFGSTLCDGARAALVLG